MWRWELYATAPDRVLETAVFTTVATLLSEHHDSRTLNRGFIYIIYIFFYGEPRLIELVRRLA